MDEPAALAALNDLLDALGVGADRTVMLHVDMAGIPLPQYPAPLTREGLRGRRDQWCAFLLEALLRRIGPDGTLIVPSYTYSCGAAGSVFDAETTPSELGPFPEFVRKDPRSFRSLHPIFSLAGVGPRAHAILDTPGGAAFGAMSPWARFTGDEVRIVTLGIPFAKPTTYVHHIEQCYGAGHRYHKVVETEVRRHGQIVNRRWLAYLRYRSIDIDVELEPLEQALKDAGVLASATWEGRESSAVDVVDLDRVGYDMLCHNPWAFADREVLMRLDEGELSAAPLSTKVAELRLSPAIARESVTSH